MTYIAEIFYTGSYMTTVEAESKEEAETKVAEMVNNSNPVIVPFGAGHTFGNYDWSYNVSEEGAGE